ncbi:MAG: ankyrin repeat domain-containing protein [Candidatus Eremiobacteraeota bacterium]|nr:ankyrin repeat domain-containing protein [Candidatus Eremiobacteraeota bacterium]
MGSFSPASCLSILGGLLVIYIAKKLCLTPISCLSVLGVLILLLAAVFVYSFVIQPLLWKNSPRSKFLDALHDDDMEMLKKLVERNPGLVRQKDELGVPLIHYTAYWGNFPALEYLVSRGANIHTKGVGRETLLHIASMKGNLPMIKFLVERGADITKPDEFGQTAIERAAFGGKESVEYLLSRGASVNERTRSGRTPLHSAINKGDMAAARLLIARGADVNAKDNEGRTPLHLSSNFGISGFLVSMGADVNACDGNGHTPLHRALDMRLLNMADLLLKSGASITPAEELLYAVMRGDKAKTGQLLSEHPRLAASMGRGTRGWTVLHEAASRGNAEIAELIIAGGADVNARDDNGLTPLHEASSRRNRALVELLLAHGSFINARTEVFDEREHGMHGGETALHMAALNGDRELFDLLAARGADTSLKDANGNRAEALFRKWSG